MLLRSFTKGFKVNNLIGKNNINLINCSNSYSGKWGDWATIDPYKICGKSPGVLKNLVDGKWTDTKKTLDVIDPINGEVMMKAPDTQIDELQPFFDSLNKVPKTGLHNPFKNPERYVKYGAITAKAAELMSDPEVEDYFVKTVQRTSPKSYTQALGEVRVTTQFLRNFQGDQVRFLARGFTVSGDHLGQESRGYRWPYGPVAIVAPFNFPLEIPVLQLMGALYLGNKPVIKGCPKVSMVIEQFVRLLEHCGMESTDVDVIHGGGEVMNELITKGPIKLTQFTGSSTVAEKLAKATNGRVKIEDAGFDWKILGPDVTDVEYVSWQCDQDAYGSTGQKCSAQSILFVHENWSKTDLLERMNQLSKRRKLDDLTIAPILTVTNERITNHINSLLKINGAKVLFGGKPLTGHSIPDCYGSFEPTAVFVPLDEMLKPENFDLCTTEIFGPFQVVTNYNHNEVDKVIEACERMSHHLTAAVVSNDVLFTQHILGNTVNGTTYAGKRARTTGAPQNHWFGPANDPRGAGIGSPEALKLVWSCHREIIFDNGPIPSNWELPDCS
eukprot:TRINITY_DN9003_c0_g1_i1.p1 TRINITY_DN9003_c0_g1~~TRINITY_DN9003_c0_g1_i1.p1  ORF type:complete len:556 (-),score=193.33 TRINITY_DN9003_c0_g1_i1:157-1824(-)